MIKILLIVLVVLYVLSPIDLLPDLIPISGWLDDAFLLGLLLYYLKRGTFPAFFSWLNRFVADSGKKQDRSSRQTFNFNTDHRATETDKDPYEILGVAPGAGQEEIKAAYRRAVQAYHPDKVSHLGREFQELAEKKFLEIQNAFEVLSEKTNH